MLCFVSDSAWSKLKVSESCRAQSQCEHEDGRLVAMTTGLGSESTEISAVVVGSRRERHGPQRGEEHKVGSRDYHEAT